MATLNSICASNHPKLETKGNVLLPISMIAARVIERVSRQQGKPTNSSLAQSGKKKIKENPKPNTVMEHFQGGVVFKNGALAANIARTENKDNHWPSFNHVR